MFVALLQFSPQARIFLQQDDRLGDQLIQGNGILRAQQFFAGAIDTRNLLLLPNLLGAFLEGVFVQRGALVFEFRRLAVHISLVILARYQLILAARKKLDEIAQELSRFGEPPILVQFQARHVSTEQDPVVHLLQRHTIRLHFFQQRFAKRMKRRKRYRLPALARGLYYAGFHLTGGFLGERQRKNVFAGKRFVRLQKVADPFRNDARFSGPRSCNHEKRSFAVGDRPALRVIKGIGFRGEEEAKSERQKNRVKVPFSDRMRGQEEGLCHSQNSPPYRCDFSPHATCLLNSADFLFGTVSVCHLLPAK